MIFLRGLWKQKPQAWGPASAIKSKVFRNNPKIKLLHSCWTTGNQFNFGSGLDLDGTPSGAMTFERNSLKPNGNYLSYQGNYNPTSNGFTVVCSGRFGRSSIRIPGILGNKNTTNWSLSAGWAINVRTYNGITFKVGTAEALQSTYAFTQDIETVLVFRWKPGVQEIFVDGDEIDYTSHNAASSAPSDGGTMRACTYYDNSSNRTMTNDDSLSLLVLYDTFLSDNKVKEISDNPYQLIRPPAFRTYFLPSGTPTIFNLAALAASRPTRIIQ